MDRIETSLELALMEIEREAPPRLAQAIRWAVFPGGARVRPRLCVAVAEAGGGGDTTLVDAAASAIELLHCASLVHDDLPCFDDAEIRRGRISVQRKFGEALAVLAGDALIVRAFETLARSAARTPALLAPLVGALGRASGAAHGLVAGQAWESEESVPLETYHRAKTSSLFVASTTAGALVSGQDPAPWRAVGERLGDAYQVADDLLDAHSTTSAAGKPVGQDAALMRPNAVTRYGTEGAVRRLRGLVADAAAAVPECQGADPLRALIVQMAERLVPPSLRLTAA